MTPTPSLSTPGSSLSRRGLLLGAGGGAALALSGCVAIPGPGTKDAPGTQPASTPSSAADVVPPPDPNKAPLRLLVYGDSITRGGQSDLVVGKAPTTSWLGHLGSGMRWVGGAARNGATAAELTAMRVGTPTSDLSVYFFGTNDLLKKSSVPTMLNQIRTFQYSLPADTRPRAATLVAVGPMNGILTGARLLAWNQELFQAASDVGWGWIDPWPTLRLATSGDNYGKWARTDQRVDNLHPSAAGAADLGAGMTAAILRLAQTRKLPLPAVAAMAQPDDAAAVG